MRTGAWSAAALAALAVQIAAAWTLRARVATVVAAVDAPAHDLEVLAGLLRILESATFESPRLVALQGALGADLPASREIGRLSRLIALLQSRQNILFALPAALVLWTSQCAFAIEAWRIRAGGR